MSLPEQPSPSEAAAIISEMRLCRTANRSKKPKYSRAITESIRNRKYKLEDNLIASGEYPLMGVYLSGDVNKYPSNNT